MTVTIGGRGLRSSGASTAVLSIMSAPYSCSRTARNPNSSSSSSIWSKSSRWLMVTMRPRFLNALPMIWLAGTSISSASSATVRNSLTRTITASSAARRWRSAEAATRPASRSSWRWRRFLPPVFSSLMTRAMFSCTASWSTRRLPFLPFLASGFRPGAVGLVVGAGAEPLRRPSGVKPSAWMRTVPPGAALAAGELEAAGRAGVRPSTSAARRSFGRTRSGIGAAAGAVSPSALIAGSASSGSAAVSSGSGSGSASGSAAGSRSGSTMARWPSAAMAAAMSVTCWPISTAAASDASGAIASAESANAPAVSSAPTSSVSSGSGRSDFLRRRRFVVVVCTSSITASSDSSTSVCPARRSRSRRARSFATVASSTVDASLVARTPMPRRRCSIFSGSTLNSLATS